MASYLSVISLRSTSWSSPACVSRRSSSLRTSSRDVSWIDRACRKATRGAMRLLPACVRGSCGAHVYPTVRPTETLLSMKQPAVLLYVVVAVTQTVLHNIRPCLFPCILGIDAPASAASGSSTPHAYLYHESKRANKTVAMHPCQTLAFEQREINVVHGYI